MAGSMNEKRSATYVIHCVYLADINQIIMVNRIIRDDPSKGDMNNRQAITPWLLWEALCDYDLWPIYLFGLTLLIPSTPATSYLTLTLKSLGFDTFTTNLLTIPAYMLFFFQLLFWTWVSEKISNRFLIALYSQLWMFPLLVALEVLPGGKAYYWARYVLNVLLVGFPYVHAMIGLSNFSPSYQLVIFLADSTLTSRLDKPKRRLSSHSHHRICSVQHVRSGIQYHFFSGSPTFHPSPPLPRPTKLPKLMPTSNPTPQIYRTQDAPLYRTGNKVLLSILAYNFILIFAMKAYYIKRNAQRAKIWNGMSEEERRVYLETTTDRGNKRYANIYAPLKHMPARQARVIDGVEYELINVGFLTGSISASLTETLGTNGSPKRDPSGDSSKLYE